MTAPKDRGGLVFVPWTYDDENLREKLRKIVIFIPNIPFSGKSLKLPKKHWMIYLKMENRFCRGSTKFMVWTYLSLICTKTYDILSPELNKVDEA